MGIWPTLKSRPAKTATLSSWVSTWSHSVHPGLPEKLCPPEESHRGVVWRPAQVLPSLGRWHCTSLLPAGLKFAVSCRRRRESVFFSDSVCLRLEDRWRLVPAADFLNLPCFFRLVRLPAPSSPLAPWCRCCLPSSRPPSKWSARTRNMAVRDFEAL